MHKLNLLVLNRDGEEVWTNFYVDFETINGYYNDPDDDTVINIVIYGTSFTVIRDAYLMAFLSFQSEEI